MDTSRIVTDFELMKKVVASTVKLQPNNYALCPFHEDKTPSFNIFRAASARVRFHCFGCQAQGDVISFVRRRFGLNFASAIRKIETIAMDSDIKTAMVGGSLCSSASEHLRSPGDEGLHQEQQHHNSDFCERDCERYKNLREDYYFVLEELLALKELYGVPERIP